MKKHKMTRMKSPPLADCIEEHPLLHLVGCGEKRRDIVEVTKIKGHPQRTSASLSSWFHEYG